MTSKAASAAHGAPGARVRLVMMGMVLTLLAAIGVSAWAQTAPPASQPTAGHAPGMHHHGGMGGPGMMGGSPERMGRMIDHMLDGVNASDAQRAQIKQIVAQAARRPEGPGRSRPRPASPRHGGLHRAGGRRQRRRAGAAADDAAARPDEPADDAGDGRRRQRADARAAGADRRAPEGPPRPHGAADEADGAGRQPVDNRRRIHRTARAPRGARACFLSSHTP